MTVAAASARERPILFSGPMVRAILDGHKTQTRRALRPQPDGGLDYDPGMVSRFALLGREVRSGKLSFGAYEGARPLNAFPDGPYSIKHEVECPYGAPGDVLWVRETFFDHGDFPGGPAATKGERIEYRVDEWDRKDGDDAGPWTPSIHMPRWASRLTLRVTDVRVERVQAIGIADIEREGIDCGPWPKSRAPAKSARERFRDLWDSINAKRGYGWNLNPWVWAIAFEVIT